MTLLQRITLLVTAGFFVGAGVYPPFEVVSGDERFNVGYGLITRPPEFEARVDTGVLLTEWLGILLVGGMLWIAATRGRVSPLRKSSSRPTSDADSGDEARNDRSGVTAARSSAVSSTRSSTNPREREETVPATMGASGTSRSPTARATLAGTVVVAAVALIAFAWREVRNAKPPPTVEDLCRFAANAVMLEQWVQVDTNIDPVAAALELYGANAKRRWTERQAQELADSIDTLREFVNEDLRVQAAFRMWLGKVKNVKPNQPAPRDRVRGALFSHCIARSSLAPGS